MCVVCFGARVVCAVVVFVDAVEKFFGPGYFDVAVSQARASSLVYVSLRVEVWSMAGELENKVVGGSCRGRSNYLLYGVLQPPEGTLIGRSSFAPIQSHGEDFSSDYFSFLFGCGFNVLQFPDNGSGMQ